MAITPSTFGAFAGKRTDRPRPAYLIEQDRRLGDAATRLKDTSPVRALGAASDVADQWQLFGVCALTVAAGLYRGDRRLAGTGLRMTAAMLLATAMKDVVKDRIDRTRPLVVADGGSYSFQFGDHDVSDLDSFPSGHTAGAVAVAQVVAREFPAMRAPASITAVAIAAIQVPRGKHYPSDLLAGAIVGWAAEVLVNLGWRIGRRSLPRAPAKRGAGHSASRPEGGVASPGLLG